MRSNFPRNRGNNRFRFQSRIFHNSRGRNEYDRGRVTRRFVTAEMVGVAPNCCLKCGNSSHKFSESHKCPYGQTSLLSAPCENCKRGGHHYTKCISMNKPYLGSPGPSGLNRNQGHTGFTTQPALEFSNHNPEQMRRNKEDILPNTNEDYLNRYLPLSKNSNHLPVTMEENGRYGLDWDAL